MREQHGEAVWHGEHELIKTSRCVTDADVAVHSGVHMCLQVAILRLHAVADALGRGGDGTHDGNGGAALRFLQCLLAHVVTAVDTFVTGEVRAVTGARPDAMEMYVPQDARFCSRQARAPGEHPALQAISGLCVWLEAVKACLLSNRRMPWWQ